MAKSEAEERRNLLEVCRLRNVMAEILLNIVTGREVSYAWIIIQ